jgi:hypothetical protein
MLRPLRSQTAQRSSWRGTDLRCAAIRSAVVRIRAPSIRFPNVILLMPVKVYTGAHFHDPARDPRSLSSGDLHLGDCARLSKDAGSLISSSINAFSFSSARTIKRFPSRCSPRTQIDYAKFYSRSHDAVIRVYDDAGNVIETHQHAGDFKEW